MKSKSYQTFQSVLQRAKNLREIGQFFEESEDIDKINANHIHSFSDMGRASIVLAVSAMDQYFTRRFCELLVPFLKKEGPTEGLLEILSEAGFDTKEALIAIGMKRPYRRIRTLVEAHLDVYTTQRFEVIDKLFIAIGLKNLCENAERKTKRKTLISSIERLVSRRHKIAHGGDVNSHGNLTEIDFKKLEKALNDLDLFVSSADSIISTRLKRK